MSGSRTPFNRHVTLLLALFCTAEIVGASPLFAQDDGTKPTDRRKRIDPSIKIGDALKLDFKARVESELRSPTPALGYHEGQLDWQDRRIGIEGSFFKRIDFEIARELGHSEVRGNAWGVVKLTLGASGFEWEFIPVAGETFRDSGSASCH